MAWPPVREPLVGSASSGHPASWASTRAGGPASSPATTTVRGPAGSSTASALLPRQRPPPGGGREVGPGVLGDQRLVELDVEVHRAGEPGHHDRTGGDVEGRREVPEEADLVGGLVGAGAPHPGRSVGGDHDEPDPGVGGLHHGGQEVGGGRPGGAHHRGPGTHLGEAEREEPGGALVDAGVQPEATRGAGCVVDRERQRRVARPRRQHHLAHPGGEQRGDDVAGQDGRGVHEG